MTDDNPQRFTEQRSTGQRSTEQVARLFEIAGREDDALRLLDGCVAQLHEVQEAKAALKMLPAAELRAALEFRRRALGGELA